MKKIAMILLILIAGGFTGQVNAQKKGRAVVCFESNMDCVDCEKTLYEHLRFEKGIKDLKVNHAANTIYVEYDEKKNTEKGFAQAVEKKGYKAEKISKERYDELQSEKSGHSHDHQNEVHRKRD